MDSIRLALAIAASKQWEVHHIDVKCSFLNEDITEYFCMKQPQGFVSNPYFVCRLNKSMYGLKKAPRACMPRFMAFFYHWVLFDASMILMFIWSWFMVIWWLFSCMWITLWLQVVQRKILPPWRMQWTMHFLWHIWDCWANYWVSKLINPNMESKHISPSMIWICWKISTWNIAIQARLTFFQELSLKKQVLLLW